MICSFVACMLVPTLRISLHKTGNILCPCKISKLQFSFYFLLQPFSYFIFHIHNLVGLLTHDLTT